MRTALPLIVGLLLSANVTTAQVERYELGRRMKRFEAEWEKQADAAERKRALTIMANSSGQFLGFQFREAARTLDEAWRELHAPDEPDALLMWGLAISPEPEARILDTFRESFKVTLRPLYAVKADVPVSATARLRVSDSNWIEVKLSKLPVTVEIPVGASFDVDAQLQVEVYVRKGVRVPQAVIGISTLKDSKPRVDAVRTAAATRPPLEAATLRDRAELLTGLLGGTVPESDYPAAELLAEAEAIARSDQLYFTMDREGQFRLSVPTGPDGRTPCRLLVPRGLDPKKPVPLVVALHGAGGSENLFFEGYGNGHIVKECEKRSWLLVAPRGRGLLGGTPPVAEIVAKLSERYPIDPKRVFLVGHSMGAAQSVELVQQYPGRFAAVACLGGGGRVRKPEAFTELPLFVRVGSMDFAHRGAKALHKSLSDAGAKRATFKEYPDLEHLVIVREALPDVFAAFDEAAR